MTPKPIEARPPRPTPISRDDQVKYATVLQMKPHEIVAVSPEPGGEGTLITTHDGVVNLVRDGTYLGLYRRQNLALHQQDSDEPWTLTDLQQEAERVNVGARAGGSMLGWVGGNPIRAFAVWNHIALNLGMPLGDASLRDPTASECRRIIAVSGWLSKTDAAKLAKL